ncbi:MAG: hypothetical protein ACOVOV_09480, partial [Dolichospermum sp.]
GAQATGNGLPATVNNLTISNSAGVTLSASTAVSNTLTLNSGSFAVGSNTLTLNGAYISGTVNNLSTTSSSNLVLNTSAGGTLPNFTAINNLTCNSSGNTFALNSSPTVSGLLAFTAGTLSIGANSLTLAGTVSRSSGLLRGGTTSNLTLTNASALGSLFFDHSTPGTTNALNNFTKNSGAGSVTIGDNTSVASTDGQLYINGVLTVSAGSLDVSGTVTGNHIVLVSDGTNQARVANLTGGNLTQGANTKIVVERFINGTNPSNRRAWRFITAPLTASSSNASIQNQWQNTGNVLGAGFGTNVNGPSGLTGRDETTPGYSMRGWNYTTKTYANVTSTSEVLFGNTGSADNKPYMMFIRGDKTALVGGSITNARLRAVGRLQTGNQAFSYGTHAVNDYVAIANPYASPINYESFRGSLTDINSSVFYVWDPRVSSFGGWVTVTRNGVDDYSTSVNTPVSFSNANVQFIQSGTAFFAQATGTAPAITFTESHKGNTNIAQVTGAGNGLMDKLGVDLLLINPDNSISVRDGLLMKYKNNFTTAINEATGEDVLKMN